MRGPTDAAEERKAYAQQSSLAALARHLGRDGETWLDTALEPLPETFRISLHRSDRAWTVEQVKALGAVELGWMGEETAFVMPFARGRAPEGVAQRMMALLHETGRITRQEAASMLPVRLLRTKPEVLSLDLCAAPGSKTTQLGERLHPHGVVVANEPVSGRLNMLVSNRSRLGLANIVVTQHDGRHFGRLPPPGFDAIIADVPCTGTATTRKNRDVWWDWTPKESRKMFKMQVDITVRGASLLVPGGHLVYSTCSMDPVENEAVVAEVLRRCPYLELVPMVLEGIVLHPGLTAWPVLDEDGAPVDLGEVEALPFFQPEHLSPRDRVVLGLGDATEEAMLVERLPHCLRLWHDDNNTGGFFVAQFRHRDEGEETVANAYRSRRSVRAEGDWAPAVKAPPAPTSNSVTQARAEVVEHVQTMYGIDLSETSLWQRGKRLNVAPPMVHERLFHPPSPTNKGDVWGGDSFHPVRVVHAGLPAFTLKKGSWRSRQEALYAYGHRFENNVATVSADVFVRLLRGWAPLLDDFFAETELVSLPAGAYLLRSELPWGLETISVWVGARITLMIDVNEQNILRYKLGLPWRDEEE
ncbi:MAG: RsmB/NOP family class I SAM-dependent RNA methyltransferase [Candidatus Thermoplasmatota archaeon]|nr:RsmB/NOP family class I SAM-dependent RNA methyltransferase [Candidatus Thermoplasmatota archaeon]